tara:strand:- start:23310 stop:23525 length:216 start_codon:yes stop_codon:yes gene_type:complete
MSELLLVPIALVTSCLAGVMGRGGDILLIALIPGLVPASVILPLLNFQRLFGWMVTLLAVRMMVLPVLAQG